MIYYYNDSMILFSIFIMIFFTLIYIVFFMASFFHIVRNIFKKGFIVHWIDYFVIIIFIISYTIEYIIYLKEIYIVKYIKKCKEQKLCYFLNMHFYAMIQIFLSNIILNFIHSVELCLTTKKLNSIKATAQSSFVNDLKKIGIKKTTRKKRHIIELFLVYLIISLYIYFFNSFINNGNIFWLRIIKKFTIFFQLIFIFLDSLMIYILKFYKKKILENNYYNKNLVLLAIYNISSSKIVFYNDFITIKSIIDLILIMSSLFFVILNNLTISNITLILIIWTFYLFFGGLLFLYIDQSNKIKINHYVGRIFLLKHMNLEFGEKEKAKLFDEYLLDLNPNETQLVDDLDIYDNDELAPLEIELGTKNKVLNGYQQVNYYLIFKLIYQYYKSNETVFKNIDNYSEEKDEKNREKNIKNIIPEIQNSFQFLPNLILSEIDDKQYCDEFDLLYQKRKTSIEYYNFNNENKESTYSQLLENENQNKNNNDNTINEFKIESLLSNDLIQLYPYYKLKIFDIIDSFSPNMNQFSIENFRNSKLSDFDMNIYYTYDNFLYFEIYDYNYQHFISNDKLKYFSKEYSKFIKEIIQNNKKTFIPFLIDVFRIKYYDYDKIIIVYKNPISFKTLISSTFNIQIILSENKEKDRLSLPIDENMNEIKTNQNNNNIIQLNGYNINSIIEILNNDSNFIQNLNFDIFPKLNLFIMTDVSSFIKDEISTISQIINREKENILEFEGSININRESILNKINSNSKENGSIILSDIELFGLCNSNNRKHIFRIYFDDFFRMSLDPNLKDIIKGDINNNVIYLNYLTEQLTKKLNSDIDVKQFK